jgi:hypothetical protein
LNRKPSNLQPIKNMKRKSILTFGLAALVVTAKVAPAQDSEAPVARAAVITDGKTATVVADKDASYDEIHKALSAARAEEAQAVRLVTLAQNAQPRRQEGASTGSSTSRTVAYDDRTGTAVVQSSDGQKYSTRLQSIIRRANPPSRVLVIPERPDDTNDIAEVEEDLNIMAHILDKAVNSEFDSSVRAMGITVTSRPIGSATGPQNLFIEGYGALFFQNVNYPLVPPPARKQEPQTKEETSSEWEQARQELFQTPGGGNGSAGYAVAGRPVRPVDPFVANAPAAEYDADKVEKLKKDLVEALKNVAHVRKLKSDETVTVVVTGSRVMNNLVATTVSSNDREVAVPTLGDVPAIARFFIADSGQAGLTSRSTVLILRVRKSDAQAFEKGQLSLDQFQEKVAQILN